MKKRLVCLSLLLVGVFFLVTGNVGTVFLNAADESSETTDTTDSSNNLITTETTLETSETTDSSEIPVNVLAEGDTAGQDLSVTAANPEQLVNHILGAGVTVSNIKYSGDPDSRGIFSGDSSILGFSNGIVLSTGRAESIVGPNKLGMTSGNMQTVGDDDLSEMIGGADTFDAAVLEFDFVTTKDTLVFDYVFGSEEYLEFVGHAANDAFAFFLDGENIALTDSGDFVSVNSINPDSNPELFRDNTSATINTELDGLTTVLQISVKVTPGETHHIKLAIADAFDQFEDSAVFIRSASFSTARMLYFDADGGSGSIPESLEHGIGESVTIPDSIPTKEGYKFTGWLSSVDEQIYQPGNSITMSEDTTLTAQWEEAITVIYDANGGTGEVPEPAYFALDAEDKTHIVAEATGLTRTDYKFVGWLSSADEQIYQPGAEITIEQNTTLTAQWEATTTYKLTYDANGGVGTVPSEQEYDPGEEAIVAESSLTKEGTYFSGWVSSADDKAYQPGETIVMDQDITLTARWGTEDPTDDSSSDSTSDTTSDTISDSSGKTPDSSSSDYTGKVPDSSDDGGKLPTTGAFDDLGHFLVGMMLLGMFVILVIARNKRKRT